ncbi:MAG: gpW family protein [Proteobacteria bacterium]|nr:gpW family protein [Pseudomonadota bacterium]
MALVCGQRKVRVTYGDRTVEYAQADLPQLRGIHREILADLARQAGTATSGCIRVTSCKGL